MLLMISYVLFFTLGFGIGLLWNRSQLLNKEQAMENMGYALEMMKSRCNTMHEQLEQLKKRLS